MDFILNADELDGLQAYLLARKWIAPDEQLLSATIPGAGNMNYTLRIRSTFRTFIIKQSRDYVEKYPHVPAPRERAVIEGRFYELIQHHSGLRPFIPELNHIDEANSIITLEDLGESNDFTFLYQPERQIGAEEVSSLMEFLSVLHREFREGKVEPSIRNRAMRALNAEHIFNYPFLEQNGFDLDAVTPGLQAVSMAYKTDEALKRRVQELSKHYLEDGPVLLHGDYYPGSWLKTVEGRVKVIDPEFCFFGPAEFDVSVMLAHFRMAQQPQATLDQVVAEYQTGTPLNQELLDALTGVEIMRRLIGLAQLPLSLDLTQKESLLQEARELVVSS